MKTFKGPPYNMCTQLWLSPLAYPFFNVKTLNVGVGIKPSTDMPNTKETPFQSVLTTQP